MTIHKAGFKIISLFLIVLILVNLGLYFLIPSLTIVLKTSIIVSSLLFIFIVSFFRSPKREGFLHENAIIAPADGKIVAIEEVEEDEILKAKAIQVSIFMSVFNVHINWFPINGVVKFFKHHSGNFMAAWLPKSSTENERTTIAIETKNGKQIVVRQVAGALAKRIVSYVEEGEESKQGKQLGFIKFGSRVDLYLPLDTRIDVKLNQKVKGKQTIIGWFE